MQMTSAVLELFPRGQNWRGPANGRISFCKFSLKTLQKQQQNKTA
jgi:hypothetical protein